MASTNKDNKENLMQIDLTKLSLQQLQQLKLEFESVSGFFIDIEIEPVVVCVVLSQTQHHINACMGLWVFCTAHKLKASVF